MMLDPKMRWYRNCYEVAGHSGKCRDMEGHAYEESYGSTEQVYAEMRERGWVKGAA